jgi:hypothetical protein
VAAAETEAWALLRRMKEDLRLVSADLLQAIRAWFAALGPEWQVDSTTVSDEGVNAHDASIHLQPVRHCERFSGKRMLFLMSLGHFRLILRKRSAWSWRARLP